MTITVTIDAASKKVLIDIEVMEKSVPRNLRRGLYFIGKKLKSTASENIKKRGRMGRVYKYKGRRHVASVAGESWANRSGKSRRGLIYKVSGHRRLFFGNTEKVPVFLEDGTQKMAPRPAHLISIQQNNRNIVKIMETELGKALGAD